MQTLIKTTLAAASALAAVSLTVPAVASDQTIVVGNSAAMEAWTQSAERSLDRRLVGATRSGRINPSSGIVQVRFTTDADGQAENVTVYNSTTNPVTDRVAKRAVRGLANLNEAPVRNASAQIFQANIIFAKNQEEHAALTRKLAKYEAKRLAMGEQERSVVLLGG